jgi:acyl-CoA reductase-like NAD-dependent aldehyde dehydrogenase
MKQAREAFAHWNRTSIKERIRYVNSLRNIIVQKMDEIAHDISETTGKTQTEAVLMELIPTLEIMKYYEKKAVAKQKGLWGYIRYFRNAQKESTHGN